MNTRLEVLALVALISLAVGGCVYEEEEEYNLRQSQPQQKLNETPRATRP